MLPFDSYDVVHHQKEDKPYQRTLSAECEKDSQPAENSARTSNGAFCTAVMPQLLEASLAPNCPPSS